MAKAPSTAVSKAKSNLPANIQAEMAQEIEDLRGRLTAAAGDRIKVDNKIFTMPNGETTDLITGIIVDFVYANSYYPGAFDKNNIVPPDCMSLWPEPKGAIPSPNGVDPQSPDCDSCWANKFESAGKGKACRNAILAAILPPDADMDTPMMVINISATALKPFNAYVGAVARSFQRMPYGVTTDFTCDPNFKFDTVRCSNPQAVDGDVLAVVRARREEARIRLMTEPDLTATKAANDPKPKSKLAAPKKPVGRKAA